MIKDFVPRLYQQTILGTAAHKNTLVVLPTGLGKTAVAFLLAAQRLHQYPNSKILMLAPTKPLCEQHLESFKKHLVLDLQKFVLFTGSIKPEKRAELWKEAQVIISTPQGLENDVINKRVRLEDTSLLIFDEAHHATGDYAYVWLAQHYDKVAKFPRILALTASPGSDLEKVKEICGNLKIEKVELRVETDADVKPYVQEIKKNWVLVEFPEEFKKVQRYLLDSKKAKLLEAQKFGYCNSPELGKKDLLVLQGELQKKASSGLRDFEMLRSISLLAEALKIDHALELLECQGLKPLNLYFRRLQQEAFTSKVKAVKNLMLDVKFKAAIYLTEELADKFIRHPKLLKLKELVEETIHHNKDSKIIIFCQFRDSAEEIVKQLEQIGVKSQVFVGQAKKNGLGFSQKQQKEILDRFREGDFNALIATSVAEEGLDIPKVDEVIFYEPIPSAIRSIQRRGRTGRLEKGEVKILITAGTRDEAYRWSAHHKEKRMYRNLEKLKSDLTLLNQEKVREVKLPDFIPKDQVVTILADHREKDNRIVKELIDLGVSVKTAQLTSADYVVSGKVGVELKKVPDFVASIIDGRLLDQARDLKNNFCKAVLIIEGEEDIYSVRKVHANAIRGMISAIVLDFGVPILYTKNPLDTAALLAMMAKREQNKDADFSYHASKPRSLAEQQEFIVSSFPNIGPQTAKLLLENFNTIKNLVNATEKEIINIKGVGEKTAKNLLEMFEKEYRSGKKDSLEEEKI
ncbi:MAG: DEAD/DEAH box helicase [Nanoarchaeota archaeon]|nr:DEAD/DEAH box helicase [Nanoarchaeota archaeon]MBU1644098.1 DEAD/DEAH box helicase [Nanoarchaeota archaeon]MBU1976724.1 DEAD/DEAH box helicase [Nanoarchaeota archaeon]